MTTLVGQIEMTSPTRLTPLIDNGSISRPTYYIVKDPRGIYNFVLSWSIKGEGPHCVSASDTDSKQAMQKAIEAAYFQTEGVLRRASSSASFPSGGRCTKK